MLILFINMYKEGLLLLWGCPHIGINIPNSIFYSTFVDEKLSITRSTRSTFFDVRSKSHGLISRIILQVGNVRKYHSSWKKLLINIKKTYLKLITVRIIYKRHVLILITWPLFIAISINSFLFPSIVGG